MRIRSAFQTKQTAEGLKADFGDERRGAETLEFPAADPGQRYPQHCPQPGGAPIASPSPLGDAIGIAGVAEMLGCSPWTVRQRYLREGLPHIRTSARGRLVFFRNQVI